MCRSYFSVGAAHRSRKGPHSGRKYAGRGPIALDLNLGAGLPGECAAETMPNENNSTEERFARQDQQKYSGWSSLVVIAINVIVVGIVFYLYYGR